MAEHLRKPDWLKIRLRGNEQFTRTKQIVDSHCLHTICTSGKCPNMGECWSRGTATFMIAGDICTRSCRFCNTKTGRPLPLDACEPMRVAESIRLMKLKHAVITSVDRDDLPDLGAAHWVATIQAIKQLNPETTVEVLIPDFQGHLKLVDQVVEAAPEIISHNMETVRRISPDVRSAARYEVSLSRACPDSRKRLCRQNGYHGRSGRDARRGVRTDGRCAGGRCVCPDHRAVSATESPERSGEGVCDARAVCRV